MLYHPGHLALHHKSRRRFRQEQQWWEFHRRPLFSAWQFLGRERLHGEINGLGNWGKYGASGVWCREGWIW